MATRDERFAKNEVLYREVNERIAEATERAGFEGPAFFVCECANAECSEVIELAIDEYEAIRAHPTFFFTVAGHENAAIERVVERSDRYAIVEKIGAAATGAEGHSTRSSSRPRR